MKRPFLVASDLWPCAPVDETQRKNGNSTDCDELDVILRAYRYAMILAGKINIFIQKAMRKSIALYKLLIKT